MKNIIKGLAVAALVTTALNAHHTNKTFLQPRSQSVNLAMEYTTWNELLMNKGEDRFGANFQVVPFYQASTKHCKTGKYFGFDNKHEIKFLGNEYAYSDEEGVFNYNLMMHDYSTQAGEAEIKLDPKAISYGVRIDYYQDLKKLLKGLYLKLDLPIVHAENKMNIDVDVTTATDVLTHENLHNYFKGKYTESLGTADAQKALSHAKMHGDEGRTGVADIDIVLGYKFLDKKKYHASLNLGLTIPTGNESEGNHVFEPMVGNGKNWGFGAGFDGAVNLWTKHDQNIKAVLALNYRYLFKHDEERILGIKEINWGQYYLVAEEVAVTDDLQAIPLANVLTKNVSVETGSQLDGIISLAYNNGGFSIELGYNLFWKDSEEVHRKGHWDDSKYALVAVDTDLRAPGEGETEYRYATWANPGADVAFAAASKITEEDISTSNAETPSQVTNKIYGGVGYIFKNWEYPLLLGLGGSYEFANSAAIEGWAMWGKVGVAF